MLASLLYLKNCKFGSVFRKASFFQRETTSSTCLQHSLWRYNTGLAYVLFNYPSAMKQHNTSPFVGQYKSHNYSDRWTCSDGWKQSNEMAGSVALASLARVLTLSLCCAQTAGLWRKRVSSYDALDNCLLNHTLPSWKLKSRLLGDLSVFSPAYDTVRR